MAYLSKEQYERRNENAWERMAENAENKALSEEQHEALAFMCQIRHEIHCLDVESLFNSESSDFDKWKYVDTCNFDNEICLKIKESKLPKWNWFCDSSTVDSDSTVYECYPEEEREKTRETAIEEISSIKEKFNSSCEEYLRMIDNKYGTSYCPTGALRY